MALATVAAATYPALGVGGSGTMHRAKHVPFRDYSKAENERVALRIARKMRDPRPTYIAFVTTTHAKALQVLFPEEKVVESGGKKLKVRVFVLHGHFADAAASVPKGERAPTGTWLAVIIDLNTGRLLDLSLGHDPPKHLSRLGRVERIEVPR